LEAIKAVKIHNLSISCIRI